MKPNVCWNLTALFIVTLADTQKGDLDNLVARIIKRGDMDNLVAR